jgi:hypothetical protein
MMRGILRSTLLAGCAALPFVWASGAEAAKKPPVRKELEALNAQIATLSTQLTAANTALAAIAARLDEIGPAPEVERLHQVELCAELGITAEGKIATLAEGEAAGEGSVGVDAYGNGASVEGKARGKAEAGVELKGALEAPKIAYCFDVLAAARNIRAARAGLPVKRGGPNGFDPTQLTPAVQDYVLSLADLSPVDLVNRAGALAQYVNLEPGALAAAMDALGAAGDDLDPMAILNGDGPLRELGASLPLPPGIRAAIEDPGLLVDRLAEFRPCEISGLKPNVQGLIDNVCALKPAWDPAEIVGSVGDLVANVQSILSKVNVIQPIITGIRTLIGRVCGAVNNIPGVEISCAV